MVEAYATELAIILAAIYPMQKTWMATSKKKE